MLILFIPYNTDKAWSTFINDDKTEFLLVGTRQQLDKLDSYSVTVGNNRISPSPAT